MLVRSAAVGAFPPLIGRCGTALAAVLKAGSTRCADDPRRSVRVLMLIGVCTVMVTALDVADGAQVPPDDAAILVIVHGHGYTGKGKCGGGSSTRYHRC